MRSTLRSGNLRPISSSRRSVPMPRGRMSTLPQEGQASGTSVCQPQWWQTSDLEDLWKTEKVEQRLHVLTQPQAGHDSTGE